MPNPITEVARVIRQFRRGVPWDSSRVAYRRNPLLAVLLAWGIGVGAVGSLWCVSPVFHFSPWALCTLVVPAAGGFYLTYLFDLLEIGLGWRTIDALLQVALGVGVFGTVATSSYGLLAGLAATAAAWTTGIRLGSDLVAFRPDRLVPGYHVDGQLYHEGLHRLVKHILTLLAWASLLAGLAARWRSDAIGWSAPLTAGAGAAAAVASAITLMGWARRTVDRRWWETENAFVYGSVDQAWVRWTWQVAAGFAGVALVLPAGLSPLSSLPFGTLFARISAVVAPFFVRGGRQRGRAPSRLGEKLATAVFDSEAAGAWDGPVRAGAALLMLALVLALLWALYRFWPLLRTGEQQRPLGHDKDKGFWRWLWSSLLGLFRRATANLFAPTQAGERSRERPAGLRKRQRIKRRVPTEPQALVRFLFGLFLERGASRGRGRGNVETAGEYQLRLAHDLPPAGAEAVSDLTGVYERVRYGQEPIDTLKAASFRRCFAAAVRALRQLP